ncbi:GNAT family N-acetyltransferase [Paenibacillus sp. HGF7]|uniref:GNAT family N-acetyltransferase n=1 Tax=Paenibacillus sp. HGF7 TaxID=944559 RepID=UPI0020167844|nr:GNAT family N-acetyltransferase [Paenibacillus sp. HGF7]
MIKAIESGNWYIGVAEAQKNIVSHMYLQLIHKVPRPGKTSDPYYGYVTNVYTRLAFRSRGIGTEIHVAMEKWSKENGVEFLILWPSSTSFMKKMDLLNVKKRWKNIGDYIARG